MTIAKKKEHYTFDEYLSLEDQNEFRSEYNNGEIFGKAGGTEAHALISTNFTRALGTYLISEGLPCRVYNSDLKVRIEDANSSVYPDGMVICGPTEFWNERKDIVLNPAIVVEVLSDGTAAYDRGGKFFKYRQLPSLQEYVLVEQDQALVDVFSKNKEGVWQINTFHDLEGSMRFSSLNVEIDMKAIYWEVVFP